MIICDGCGVEITWSPVTVNDRYFCCSDCQLGKPCTCGDRMDEEDEHRDNISVIFDFGGRI
jgi:hypothetical protein